MAQLLRLGGLISGGNSAPIAATPQATFANVVFLMPFDGIDDATTTPELSNSSHTLTYNNQARIHTGIKKFGTASLLLDGISDGVTAPDHADWSFGAGEFTIEAWVRLATTVNARNCIASQWASSAGSRSFLFELDDTLDTITLNYSTDGTATIVVSGAFAWDDEVWYHVAVDMDASNDIRIYVDGVVVVGPTAAAVTLHASAEILRIGHAINEGALELSGRMDDVRIVKGEAVYGGAFNPPTEAHPTS